MEFLGVGYEEQRQPKNDAAAIQFVSYSQFLGK
jgi:hypothetical protein